MDATHYDDCIGLPCGRGWSLTGTGVSVAAVGVISVAAATAALEALCDPLLLNSPWARWYTLSRKYMPPPCSRESKGSTCQLAVRETRFREAGTLCQQCTQIA